MNTEQTSIEQNAAAPLPLQLMQMIDGYWVSQAIHVAAKLGLADHLTDGSQSSEALSQQVEASPQALYRLMRACASFGLFTEVETGSFALTRLGDLLRTDAQGSLRDRAIAVVAPGHWLPWGKLDQAVRSGKPTFRDACGMELWEYYAQNSDEGMHFAKTMGRLSAWVAQDVVSHYDVSQFKKIVDVGGSQGVLLNALLQAAPAAQGILFDLPHVIDDAPNLDRIEAVSGDFFQEVPSGGDLYLLKHVLHDWDDERCMALLRNIHRVAKKQSRLLVIEMLVPQQPEPSPVYYLDLTMLALVEGRERTQQEFEALLSGAGFEVQHVIPTPSLISIIEAIRI
jgi:hypothetical protein